MSYSGRCVALFIPMLLLSSASRSQSPRSFIFMETVVINGRVEGRFGLQDQAGGILVPARFVSIHDFSEGLAAASAGTASKWTTGFIDRTGEWIIQPKFNWVRSFSEGLAAVEIVAQTNENARTSEPGQWGFINRSGNLIIPAQYKSVSSFHEGLAAVQTKTAEWGYIDKTGRVVIEPRYHVAEQFSEGLARVSGLELESYRYIDREGRTVFEVPEHFFDPSRGYSFGSVEGISAASFNGNFSEGVVSVPRGRKWGFKDRTGKWVIEPKYDGVLSFSDGLAGVLMVGQGWGYINKAGQVVIPHRYPQVGSFSEGLARFLSGPGGSVWGYIDKGGQVAIPPKFPYGKAIDSSDDAFEGAFSDGLAKVWYRVDRTRLGVAYISRAGGVVWKSR